jgi:tetratricopeptide (TPR) repeat protein
VVYLGASYAVLEAVDLFIERFGLPAWLFPIAFVLLLVGLPVVVVTVFAHEETAGDLPPAEAGAAAEAAVTGAGAEERSRTFTWRTAGLAFLGALAMWGVVAAGYLALGGRVERPVEAAAFDPARRIAVMPFSYRGEEESAGLGDAMVHLLSQTLDGAEVRTVVPQAVIGIVDQEGGGAPDNERGNAVAERLGAGRYLLGDVVEAGGRLRISARLYDTGAGAEDIATASVEGDPDGLFGLVDDLTAEILVGAFGAPTDRLAGIAAQTTDSLAALKAYLDGKREYRQSNTGKAVRAYQRAVEIDSTFALAWFEISLLADFGGSIDLIVEPAEKAVRYSDRLPQRERQLIEAHELSYVKGAADSAEVLLRDVLRRYPDDVAAWFELGMLFWSWNAQRGRPQIEAREPFERVLRYEPDQRYARFVLTWAEAVAGNWAKTDSLLRRAYPDGEFPLRWRAAFAYGQGDVVAQERILAEAERRGEYWFAARFAAIAGKDPRGARDIAVILAETGEELLFRVRGRLIAGTAEVALGRLHAAEAEYAAVATTWPALAREFEVYWNLPRFFQVPRARLKAMRDALVHWEAEDAELRTLSAGPFWEGEFDQYDRIHPHVRLYLLGRLSTRMDDHEAALDYADELERLEAPEKAGRIAFDLAQGIRAHVLRNQGRPAEALAALQQMQHVSSWENAGVFYEHSQERFLRGELLAELGQLEEALRWYGPLGTWLRGVPLMAPSHLRQAEIYERLGDEEQASHHYNRFITLWSDSDPELQPQVDAARRALSRLTGEGMN